MKYQGALFMLLLTLLSAFNMAYALEYVSVSDATAILFDANSTKAKKLYVISRYTPLEKVVDLKSWIKVRDSSGTMAWIERRAVSDKHYVVVNVPVATVRQSPEDRSPVLYQVAQNVVLESLGVNGGGWVKARHQDGSIGYIKSADVWGAE